MWFLKFWLVMDVISCVVLYIEVKRAPLLDWHD